MAVATYMLCMKQLAILCCLAMPAHAWEFTPGLPCLLSHETDEAAVELTYDPTAPLYSITITRAAPWPDAPVFRMRFDGMAPLTISTDRQTFSADRRALTVIDRGFGNVLNGLQYNETASALLGDTTVMFPLKGAEEPVAAFRACRPRAGA